MLTTDELRARLHQHPEAVAALVRTLVDGFLDQPASALIDPPALAADVAAGLRATVEQDHFRTWLIEQIEIRRKRLPRPPQALRLYLPPDLPSALDRAARRDYVPSRALVRAAVDHPATRELVRTILQTTLLEFATRLWTSKKIPGSRLRSGLMGMAKGVAGFVGTDGALEDRVNRFVDGTLGLAIDRIVERVADPKYADQLASQRALMIRAALDLPVSTLAGEADKFPTSQLEEDAHAIIVAVARWDKFETILRDVIGEELQSYGDASIRTLLEPSGLLAIWRPTIEAVIARHALTLVTGDGFLNWVLQLTDPAGVRFEPQTS